MDETRQAKRKMANRREVHEEEAAKKGGMDGREVN
jgi:hypothetical protein